MLAFPVIAILMIVEADILLRTTLRHWLAGIGTITFHLYSITFILWFLMLEKTPFANRFTELGKRSYGIYLVHMTAMLIFAKVVYNFTPQFLAYPLLFEATTFIVGLGVPLIMMTVVEKSPMRRFYLYLFG